ncbi:MAG: hypothetical protein ACJAZM_000570 [Cyclobacteriaceae bacterium]|jgi:hypothetical protein
MIQDIQKQIEALIETVIQKLESWVDTFYDSQHGSEPAPTNHLSSSCQTRKQTIYQAFRQSIKKTKH